MREDLRQLRQLLTPDERRRWLTLLPVAAIAVLLEATGAAALITLLGQALRSPEAATRAALFAVLLAGLLVVRGGLVFWVAAQRERAIAQSISALTGRLLAAYLQAPYASMLGRHSAHVAQRVTQTVEQVIMLVVVGLFTVAAELLVAIAITIVLLVATPLAAVGAVAAAAALVASALMITRPRFASWSATQLELHQQSMKELQEGLGALAELKVLGVEHVLESRVASQRRTLAELQSRRRSLSEALRIGIETTVTAALLLSVVVIVWRGMSPVDAVATLGLYAYAALRLIPSANRINAGIGLMRSGRPYLRELQREWSEIRDLATPTVDLVPTFPRLDSSIRFEHVSFSYPDGAVRAVHDINLTIARGEFAGIAGPIGSGKSTLAKIVLGLLTPTEGRVLVDGLDLQSRLASWRTLVGYVPQQPYLLADTVRRNIAFGRAETEIDDAAVNAAVRAAGLERVVSGLRSGIDTILGEHGGGLSGGEQQLLVLARALYRNPALLVLDEPTASLDESAQHQVSAALRSLRGRVTIIAVSHRPEILAGCDRLIVMRDGRAADGSLETTVTPRA